MEEWIAFHELYPFGDEWDMAATIAHATSAPHLKTPISMKDFIPKPVEPQSQDAVTNTLFGMVSVCEAYRQ